MLILKLVQLYDNDQKDVSLTAKVDQTFSIYIYPIIRCKAKKKIIIYKLFSFDNFYSSTRKYIHELKSPWLVGYSGPNPLHKQRERGLEVSRGYYTLILYTVTLCI